MKTEIIIFVRLTDGTRLRYSREIPGFLPVGYEVYYGVMPTGPTDEDAPRRLREKQRFVDLKTESLHVWFAIDVEMDAQDIPFDTDLWKLEKVY